MPPTPATLCAALALTLTTLPSPAAATPFPAAEPVALIAGQGVGDINRTKDRFQVYGADLGVLWQDSRGRTSVFFGDSYGAGWGGRGAGPATADWRFNTLAHTTDANLSDGLKLDMMETDRPGHASQLLEHDPAVSEVTVIPTTAISIGTRDIVHYMSVAAWDTGGRWTTNYSGLASSGNGGRTWTKVPGARWPNTGAAADFQLGAFARHGGFVYLFGTPDGRLGNARLARVADTNVLDVGAYRYWNGTGWGPAELAVPVMDGPVGELSVQYNTALSEWVALYLDESRAAIVLRTAPAPTGPWSVGQVVVAGTDHPGLYGAFLHPASARTTDLYFAMSEWDPYHVQLMHLRVPKTR